VVGAGALGSATAYWLTRAGVSDVLVLEQYHLEHGRGASEDHSRIIRHAYHPRMWHDFALQPGLLAAADSALTQAAWFVSKVTASS
jgi:glycine/D-amino acid oxidase-like deaminating enzyme